MKKTIITVAAYLVLGALGLAAQSQGLFKGEICLAPAGQATTPQSSEAQPQCAIDRVKRNARFVLFNAENKTIYQLGGSRKIRALAGANALVIGTLDQAAGTISVSEIMRALPPKVMRAKSAYIECDACPRGMAAAWRAAFEELTAWGRFELAPDPKKADLIFLFSANPYLGDYLTRDGPDRRPVTVKTTFMDVVDPNTGQSLWADSKVWGSFLVTKATKALIVEFKERVGLEESAGKS